jgi:hypothetical protein
MTMGGNFMDKIIGYPYPMRRTFNVESLTFSKTPAISYPLKFIPVRDRIKPSSPSTAPQLLFRIYTIDTAQYIEHPTRCLTQKQQPASPSPIRNNGAPSINKKYVALLHIPVSTNQLHRR